ncbi:MAG: hypothetical protein KJO75_08125 [Dactylosporangium sp.]|nr:hypothetical protein [Dactylosporangium sp.]
MTIMSTPCPDRGRDPSPTGRKPASVSMRATQGNRRPLLFSGDPDSRYVRILAADGWSVSVIGGDRR